MRPIPAARLLSVLTALLILVPRLANAVALDWWANRTSTSCVFESTAPGTIRLDNCASGFIEGDITLPSSGNWKLSFDVEPDESTGRKPNDYVDVFINSARIGRYYNTPAAPALHHVSALVNGSSVHYRFEFLSTDLATHIHMVVRAGQAELEPAYLTNPSFDGGTYVNATPTTTGDWQGNLASYVTAENGVTPFQGGRMLKFLGTANGGASTGAGCEAIQLVSMAPYASAVAAGIFRLEASAYVNRVALDSQTDTQFGIELVACSGSMSSFPPPAANQLARARTLIRTDGDPATWERIPECLLHVPYGTTYVAYYLFADEDVMNDGTAPEFDGHYADGVTLLRVAPPAWSCADLVTPEGNAGAHTLTVPVALSAPIWAPASITASTTDGTATAGDGDFLPTAQTLTVKPTLAWARKWGSVGSGNSQFDQPSGIAADRWGNIWVADGNNHRVVRYTRRSDYAGKFGTSGSSPGQLGFVVSVAVDPIFGHVYVGGSDSRISEFTADGTFVREWGSPGTGPGQFSTLSGIAVDSQGNVYAADWGTGRIQKFSSTGTFLLQWGSLGSGISQQSPRGIAIGRQDVVYVSDTWNPRIQRYSSTGAPLGPFGGFGSGPGQLNQPWGLCIDAEGNVLVADRSNNRIQMFTASGTWLTQWGSSGSGDGQFNAPIDVSSAPNGVVYVVETGGNRVQSFEPRDPSTSLGLIVSGDARLESNENFALSFGAPAASVAPAAPATITLTNDDVGVFSTSGASTSLVGSAMVSPIADGLRLSNLGLAGADGAEVTAGGLKLSSTQPGSIGFAADFASAATIPAGGANVVARMVGTVAGVPQATMGTYTVNLLPTGANSVGVDFSGVGASQWNVAVYNGATLVHQRTGHSGVGVGYQSCGPEPGMHASATGDPIPGVDVEIEQVPGGIAVTSRPGGCTHIDLGDGTGVHAGDRIVFRSPSPALRSGDGLAAVRFTSSLSSLDVKSLGLRVLGALHRSSGNALFAANYNSAKSNTGCIMKNIGPTGGDGVRIAVPEGKKAVHTEFGNTAFQSSDAGASLTARAVGTANGTPNTTLFTLSQTATSTGTQLRANFTGASVESVVVLNAGAVAYRGEVANNVVVGEEGFQSPALGAHEANGPARVEAAGDPIPGVDIEIEQVPGGISAGRSTVLNYRNPRTFNIGGVLYSGNVISFKRAFSRGLHAQVVDDSTATLDEVQWIATNPGATTLDSLEIVAETIGAGGTGTTGVGDSPARVLSALRAWPNPSGGRTGVAFTLGSASRVRVVIYDVAGREVREWHARRFEAGEHHVEWDGLDAGDHPVAAGIYFARVEAGGMRHELKLVRLH